MHTSIDTRIHLYSHLCTLSNPDSEPAALATILDFSFNIVGIIFDVGRFQMEYSRMSNNYTMLKGGHTPY